VGGAVYWQKWTEFSEQKISKDLKSIEQPLANPVYESQFTFDTALENRRLMLRRYYRGDDISALAPHFPGLLDAWELSNRLAEEICCEHDLKRCREWMFSLSNLCFWLVGLALALEIPDEQWFRLVALIGGEGEDKLLDKIIASRKPGRRLGDGVLHPKPYARLLKTINAPRDQQAILLREFVDHWYPELERTGKQHLWWYDFGDPEKHPLEMGSYFGRWCIEAVAAVKAFGIDDSLCLDHPHYPGDLIQDGRSPRYPDPETPPPPDMRYVKFGTDAKESRLSEWISRVVFGSRPRS
jgi:hypothetical protein